MAKKTQTVETEKAEVAKKDEVLRFSKKQFVSSQRFAKQKDLVNALLEDDKQYSIEEVECKINNFLYKK